MFFLMIFFWLYFLWGLLFGGHLRQAEQPEPGRELGTRIFLSKRFHYRGWLSIDEPWWAMDWVARRLSKAEEEDANILFAAAHCFEFLSAVLKACLLEIPNACSYCVCFENWKPLVCCIVCMNGSCFMPAAQCYLTMILGKDKKSYWE